MVRSPKMSSPNYDVCSAWPSIKRRSRAEERPTRYRRRSAVSHGALAARSAVEARSERGAYAGTPASRAADKLCAVAWSIRICLATGIVVLAGTGCVSGAAGAEPLTTETLYQAFTPRGVIRLRTRTWSGFCNGSSEATLRRDAWRCFSRNYVIDPCFSSPRDKGIVACPEAPWLKTGIKLRLTKPLPRKYGGSATPSLRLQPWAIELSDGQRCLFNTAMGTIVEGQRNNYLCGVDNGWGFPSRAVEPWTIAIAPLQASTLSARATVLHAWM